LLFSNDPAFDMLADTLRDVAAELQAIRQPAGVGQHTPTVQSWHLGDADCGQFYCRIPVPTLLTEREVLVSPVVVFRRYLPSEMLKGPLLPVLLHPDAEVPMVLPRRFWPQALVAQWSA
jgi:hypothetical protein